MEALIFIALLIIIILLFNIKSFHRKTADRTHQSFLSLKKELLEIKKALDEIKESEETIRPTDEKIVQWRPQPPSEKAKQPVTPVPEQHQPPELQPIFDSSGPPVNEEQNTTPAIPKQTYSPTMPAESWYQKWLLNNPDLEKFIGENLVNKIGITVLVLGIAFFVKYAIDQNWIKEAGRVGIGILCGIILVALAHYLRNTYRSFSSVLAGGGIAVFYFSIAFAFQSYQLFSQTTAFVIMVIITMFAVAISLVYNRLELAIIAAIGGFITPFLVSSGAGNYIVLFTYLLILNMGMLALAYFKKWQALNVIALFFTAIIYGGWLLQSTLMSNQFLLYKNSLAFSTAFYVLFLGMSMIYNVRTRQDFKGLDFSMLIAITFAYYAAGMTNLQYWNEGAYQGLFTLSLGAINFCLAAYFYITGKGDKNLLYLLIGLALTFISLAIPIQLHGHTITLFWSAEFVLLYWLYQRSKIIVFKYSSFIIMPLMLISLLVDWQKSNDLNGDHLLIIYKGLQGFITNIVAVLAFAIYAVLLRKEQSAGTYIVGIRNNIAATAMIMIAATLFYLTCVFGVNLYFYNNQNLDVPNTWHQLITYLFIALLLWLIDKFQLSVSARWRQLLIAGCVIMYFFSTVNVIHLRNGVLADKYPAIHLWVHWMAAVVLLYLIYRAIITFRKNESGSLDERTLYIWLVNSILVTFFSLECMHAYVLATAVQQIDVSLQQYSKAGLTIVWALCSFAIMWLGMRHKYKTLRIISLALFSVALIKLFLFDIRNISEGGKIAAFIMLGILLLIISFMYQKLKKIIID
ncbi:MAG: DUF2339 domain-containing protein [Ferruginibacter sp.]